MRKRACLIQKKRSRGFTIIELLLVITIIGVILAVVVPRAWRAGIEAKYSIVAQSATELGSWGMTWAEKNLESQSPTDYCNLQDYVVTLGTFVGRENWTQASYPLTTPWPCHSSASLTFSVADIMPPEKQPRNPFNGLSYFDPLNNGNTIQPGVLYLGLATEGTFPNRVFHYYFVYSGTEATTNTSWHAGMGSGLNPLPIENLRNGIFMARLQE